MGDSGGKKRFLLIACAVLARECYHCAAASPHIVEVRLLEQGLHDIGEAKMAARIQGEIDAAGAKAGQAILLAYGLCSNGIRGLRAPVPLVVPRAHDCITLLMGSKERYQRYFDAHPGTYFRSIGWIENSSGNLDNPDSTTRRMGIATYQEYVEKYGEENAQYLCEILNDHLKNYRHLAFIRTGVAREAAEREQSQAWAREKGWAFSEMEGDLGLLSRLAAGAWDPAEFLIVPPGQTIEASHGPDILRAI